MPNSQFDQSSYITFFGGGISPEFDNVYIACAKKFLEDIDQRSEKLHTAILEKNFESTVLLAHQFKGSFRTLGGIELGRISGELEETAKEKNLEKSKELLSEMIFGIPLFKTELENFVAQLLKKRTSNTNN